MRKSISLLIAVVLMLVLLGVVMLASSSYTKYDDSFYFVRRQLVWLTLAVLAAVGCAWVPYKLYERLIIPFSALCILLLGLVRIPGIGLKINGSYRWLEVGPLRFQPSEFSKIAVIMLMAWWLARHQRRIDEFRRGVLIPCVLLGIFVVPILFEPDFGTTMLVSTASVFMMILAGAPLLPIAVIGALAVSGIAVLLFNNPERLSRIMAFLDPKQYEQDKAWQLVNSLRAIANGGREGGLWGVGLGESTQKYHYLPEAHTDFIFAIIAEETGLVGSLAVILCFAIIFFCGFRIATGIKDGFGRYLAMGITLMITIQALINFAVVTGCVPTKGLALPFISYGGSSLLVSGAMIGILLNIAHEGMRPSTDADSNLFKDKTPMA